MRFVRSIAFEHEDDNSHPPPPPPPPSNEQQSLPKRKAVSPTIPKNSKKEFDGMVGFVF